MLLIKMIGLSLLFICCCSIGFLRASALSKRAHRLSQYMKGTGELAQRIRSEATELKRLLHICYPKELIQFEDNNVLILNEYLLKEDISLLEEFFSGLGIRESTAEYERCILYKELIDNRRCDAEKSARELSKLYNTLGVLGGLFIVLFFL